MHGRARNRDSLVNASTLGGDKKMGTYPSVGKSSWTSIAYGRTPGDCLTLTCTQTLRGKLACVSRPVGSSAGFPYFKC